MPILSRLSVSLEAARRAETRATAAVVPFQVEILAAGLVGEHALFRALADDLGVAFSGTVEPATLVLREKDGLAVLKRRSGAVIALALEPPGRETTLLIAPDRLNIPEMRRYLSRYPEVAARMRIVPPSALRRAIIERCSQALERIATHGLSDARPGCSARQVVSARQGAFLGAVLVALPVSLLWFPTPTTLVLHGLSSAFFLACVGLRAAVGLQARPPKRPALAAVRPDELPVYTVLVALYREANIVPELLTALGKIAWPRSKLEVKLVCEADDHETLAAIKAQSLRSYIEVVEVPPGTPRTKPKALSYALPLTSGDYVVLYDAEDRPHPFQLVEAWQRFQADGPDIGCLQAPLVISNRRESWLAALFTLEYAALFRGILPWLARRKLPFPLGGTSNHFRRDAIEAVGGWDPFNVTEDADLGLRLKRFGYETRTIATPTFEDAPDEFGIWLPQRTRWFKGWIQTWLVHMRSPAMLARELGAASFTMSQILLAGMLVSALVHPYFLATVAWLGILFVSGESWFTYHSVLLAVDCINIVGGYGTFLFLGWRTLTQSERPGFWAIIPMTPIYWALMSLAAWRAVWQLYRRPHHWDKTPHKPRQGLAPRFSEADPARFR